MSGLQGRHVDRSRRTRRQPGQAPQRRRQPYLKAEGKGTLGDLHQPVNVASSEADDVAVQVKLRRDPSDPDDLVVRELLAEA